MISWSLTKKGYVGWSSMVLNVTSIITNKMPNPTFTGWERRGLIKSYIVTQPPSPINTSRWRKVRFSCKGTRSKTFGTKKWDEICYQSKWVACHPIWIRINLRCSTTCWSLLRWSPYQLKNLMTWSDPSSIKSRSLSIMVRETLKPSSRRRLFKFKFSNNKK